MTWDVKTEHSRRTAAGSLESLEEQVVRGLQEGLVKQDCGAGRFRVCALVAKQK